MAPRLRSSTAMAVEGEHGADFVAGPRNKSSPRVAARTAGSLRHRRSEMRCRCEYGRSVCSERCRRRACA
eukprot:scaffold100713_cov24-Tisochrysis_lutea.AAC.2